MNLGAQLFHMYRELFSFDHLQLMHLSYYFYGTYLVKKSNLENA